MTALARGSLAEGAARTYILLYYIIFIPRQGEKAAIKSRPVLNLIKA